MFDSQETFENRNLDAQKNVKEQAQPYQNLNHAAEESKAINSDVKQREVGMEAERRKLDVNQIKIVIVQFDQNERSSSDSEGSDDSIDMAEEAKIMQHIEKIAQIESRRSQR